MVDHFTRSGLGSSSDIQVGSSLEGVNLSRSKPLKQLNASWRPRLHGVGGTCKLLRKGSNIRRPEEASTARQGLRSQVAGSVTKMPLPW